MWWLLCGAFLSPANDQGQPGAQCLVNYPIIIIKMLRPGCWCFILCPQAPDQTPLHRRHQGWSLWEGKAASLSRWPTTLCWPLVLLKPPCCFCRFRRTEDSCRLSCSSPTAPCSAVASPSLPLPTGDSMVRRTLWYFLKVVTEWKSQTHLRHSINKVEHHQLHIH